MVDIYRRELAIDNDSSEGDFPIRKAYPFRRSKHRTFLVGLAIIFSGFLLLLVFKLYRKLYVSIIYAACTIENATHLKIDAKDYPEEIVKIRQGNSQKQKIKYIQFNELRYEIKMEGLRVNIVDFTMMTNKQLKTRSPLYQSSDLAYLQAYHGPCDNRLPQVRLLPFIYSQLTTPLYYLQFGSLMVLFTTGGTTFAIVIFVASFTTIIVQYVFLCRQTRVLQLALANKQKVLTLRQEQWTEIDSNELVPGDQIRITNQMKLPCDCLLINGDASMDESSLFGKAAIEQKQPISNDDDYWKPREINTLFSETVVCSASELCLALVIRTGFTTRAGVMYRNAFFGKHSQQFFFKNAVKFLGGIFVLMHILYFIDLYFYERLHFTGYVIFLRYLLIVSRIFPPQLPIAVRMKGTMALINLKKQGVIGQRIQHLQLAGKTNMILFDKTGTLTKPTSIKGFWVPHNGSNDLLKQISSVCTDNDQFQEFGCQKKVNNCQIIACTDGQEIQILDKTPFNHQSKNQSVKVLNKISNITFDYIQGAVDSILQMCHDEGDFRKKSIELQLQGYQVIALASKETSEEIYIFQGFIYSTNELQDDTVESIEELNDAGLSLKMVTGDQPYTAITVARQSGIQKGDQVMLLDFRQSITLERISYSSITAASSISTFELNELSSVFQDLASNNVAVAVTGSFFEYLMENEHFEVEPLEQNLLRMTAFNSKYMMNLLQHILNQTIVYARLTPTQKKMIVVLLQKRGNIVTMVGDGSNDLMALQQADVSVSFQSCDGSRVASFVSMKRSIKGAITCIQAGRQSILTVSLIFQYLVAAICILNAGRLILVVEAGGFSQMQTIYLVLIQQLSFQFIAGKGEPLKRLANRIPIENQFSFRNQIAMYYQLIIVLFTQILLVVYIQTDDNHYFEPPPAPVEDYIYTGPLQTALFPIIVIGSTTFVFNMYITHPFQEHAYKNARIAIWCLFHWCYGIAMIFNSKSSKWMSMLPQDSEIPNFQYVIFAFIVISNLLMIGGAKVLDHIVPRSLKVQNGKLLD